MKTLTLSIKQKYFDEILAGTKKQEFREIRPTNAKKYFRYVLNGKEYDEDMLPSEDEEPGEVDLVPVKYEYNGKQYLAAQIVYDLGKVIDKSNY